MLRVRLILWYSLLVVLTVTAVGLVQVLIIQRSMMDGLDNSLIEDANVTLQLVSSLPADANQEMILQHGRVHSSGSLRDLVDHVLSESPDTLHGTALTDSVISHLVDEMLTELSFDDSSGRNIDPLDAIVRRNVASRHNNMVEIHLRPKERSRVGLRLVSGPSFFRTTNLGNDTLSRLFRERDTLVKDSGTEIREVHFRNERARVARAANTRFAVYIGFPSTDIEDSISRLRYSFLYLIPLALLVSILGGLWLARKALKPIEHIADTARDIGAKNLSQRIELPGRTDRELRELTETLNSMFSRLENSFRQVTQFTSDASHELRTPLAIMKGEIEQARRHLDEHRMLGADEARNTLESLMEEVSRVQRIVEGLLLLSRADDHRLPLEKEPVNIYQFLDSLSEDGEILAEERGLKFERKFDSTAKSVVVNIDATRFYQVIMNLLDNALKYTPSGTVTMFIERIPGAVQFGIEDTGLGISEEDLPKIFQRFYRTDEARSGPRELGERSLGLGLAIVKSIVEAHDGQIAVESKKGVGTRFIITLPTEAKVA
jgi:signal transduction histidine kinase